MSTNESKTPSYPGLKILVVDDVPTNLKVLSHVLSKFGSLVETCESGEEALRLCSLHDFHLILLDLHMPAMSGFEAGEKIIEARKGRMPLVVAQTADETKQACDRTKAIGFDGHLAKPIRAMGVAQYLERALSLTKAS